MILFIQKIKVGAENCQPTGPPILAPKAVVVLLVVPQGVGYLAPNLGLLGAINHVVPLKALW